MNLDQLRQVAGEVEDSLLRAEKIWDKFGSEFSRTGKIAMALMEDVEFPSQIPGHPIVVGGKPKIDNFIAIVADMRDSTKHMLEAIGDGRPSLFKRVLFETSALLTALCLSIEFENGSITEYLGDGVLGLFSATEDLDASIYASYSAAKNCLQTLDSVVNAMLNARYNLPPLRIGVGLSLSTAVVTLVGTNNFMQPKAIGECVFRASKLAGGNNEIGVDIHLENAWPTGTKPGVRFIDFHCRGESGFKAVPM